MIEATKLKLISGNILVAAVYNNSGVPAILHEIANNETVAGNIVRKWEKMVLRGKISKFLNHRQNIMEYHGGLRTEHKLEVWNTMKRNFDYLHDKTLESNCKFIVTGKEYFESLMPGEKSRFYESTRNTMNEIYAYCESKTK